jgi:hypothetical protein
VYENIRIRVFELNRDHKKKSDVGEYLSNKSTLILFFLIQMFVQLIYILTNFINSEINYRPYLFFNQ